MDPTYTPIKGWICKNKQTKNTFFCEYGLYQHFFVAIFRKYFPACQSGYQGSFTMVFILDGNLELGAHERSNLCY